MEFKRTVSVSLVLGGLATSGLADTNAQSLAQHLAQLNPIGGQIDRLVSTSKTRSIALLNGSDLSKSQQETARKFIVQEWDNQTPELTSIFVNAIDMHLTARQQEILLAHFSDVELLQALAAFDEISGVATNDLVALVSDTNRAIKDQISEIEND